MRKRQIVSTNIASLFLFFLFTALYFSSTVGGMNSADGSQYALTQAIAEKGTFAIDDFRKWTYRVDYALANSHYYLDREPGLSILSIPFYIAGKHILPLGNYPYGGRHPAVDEDSILQALTYLSTASIGALGVAISFLICLKIGISKKSSFFTAIIIGAGTLMWKYSASFFREPTFITFFLLSWYFAISSVRLRYVLASGIMVGFALYVDYSKFFIIPIFILYYLIKFKKRSSLPISLFVLGLLPLLLSIFFYNFKVFRNPFTNPHLHKAYFTWMNNPENLFQTPLLPSVATNLFSFGPIDPHLLTFYWDHPTISRQMGALFATVWPYKGIFIQTPALFFAIVGWIFFLKKKKREAIFMFLSILIMFVASSKLTIFWATNMYDTRYFLPVAVVSLLGFGFFLDTLSRMKHTLFISIIRITTLVGIFFSIENGWYSNLTHFAPHVSGEHRFYLSWLHLPFFTPENLTFNIKLFFDATFPNIYNLHLLLLFYFPLFFLIFVVIFRRNTLSRQKYDRYAGRPSGK
ncbi:hypothetical protein HYW55_06805 [Candidatus Gottesmanbacteria bacterium]|nr:hypothetical protein [Candidatus Gottesmanbacteria bacterium]